jgi:hypothetical protein
MKAPFPHLLVGPLKLWTVLRLLSVLVAAVAYSYHRPVPDRPDERIPMPDRSAEQVFVAPWYRYDAVWYVRIHQNGYRSDDGTANFHPLYPWVARLFSGLPLHPLWSLQLVSTVAGALLVVALWRLALLDLTEEGARAATLLFLCWPVTFVIFAPYTEGLWLLLAVLCVYYGRKGRWWWAGLMGGLASLTRQQGLFLAIPLAWEMWEALGRDWRRLLSAWKHLAALALVPLGYFLWVFVRAILIRDFRPRFDSLHDFVYTVLISPNAEKIVKGQAFLPPWEVIGKATSSLWDGEHQGVWLDLTFGAAFIVLLAVAWGGMRASYKAYSVLIVLVSLSYYTGEIFPYMGLPRHLLLAFPVFIGFAANYRLKAFFIFAVAGIAWQMFLVCLFVWNAWVP